MNGFLLHEFFHFLIGLGIGLISYWLFRQKKLISLAIFMSLGIDIDHLVDYFHYFGPKFANPVNGLDFFCLSGKLFIPLHAWEFLPILFFLGIKFRKTREIFWTIALVLAGHYFLDQFSHDVFPLGYSFVFRLLTHFNINAATWGCTLQGAVF